jgi:uncharacterized membrane protein
MKLKDNFFKYFIGLFLVLLYRLTPHPPNVEPIMTTMMPFSKKWGIFAGLLFTFLAMIIFDVITKTLGWWTILTISTYCVISIFAGYFFKNRSKKIHYVVFALIATLFYDIVTGFGVGMLVFKQSFIQTFYFQIPFTLYHVLSNVVLAYFISPLIYRWVLANPKLETVNVLNYFKNLFSYRIRND